MKRKTTRACQSGATVEIRLKADQSQSKPHRKILPCGQTLAPLGSRNVWAKTRPSLWNRFGIRTVVTLGALTVAGLGSPAWGASAHGIARGPLFKGGISGTTALEFAGWRPHAIARWIAPSGVPTPAEPGFAEPRNVEPLFGDLRWAVLRQLESLPEAQWVAGVDGLLQQYGESTRQALVLLAGSPERATGTRAVQERRARLRDLALERVAHGLRDSGPAWDKALQAGLDLRGLRAQGVGEPMETALAYRLACLRLAARLQRTDWAEAIAAQLLRRTGKSEASADMQESGQALQPADWEARMAHAEAQESLFHLFGLRFEDYEAFQAFPRLSAQALPAYRQAFLAGAQRESELQERLLQQSAEHAVVLLSHPDARLRRAAVRRMIEAVGEQALPLQEVLTHLQARLHQESSEPVFDALLRATFELALAAGPESRLAAELRASLYSLRATIPTPLAAALMNGIERLPRREGLPLSDYQAATELLLDLFDRELRLDSDSTVQILQSWGRLSAHSPEHDEARKARCEQHILGLMVGANEAERVRVAAAEALASSKVGAEAMARIVQLLVDPESPDELRLDGYPLVKAALSRTSLTEPQTQQLLEALMRDWGSPNADLARRALGWVGELALTEALYARERSDGTPLARAMEVLYATPAAGLRTELMRFVAQVAQATGQTSWTIPCSTLSWPRGCIATATWWLTWRP